MKILSLIALIFWVIFTSLLCVSMVGGFVLLLLTDGLDDGENPWFKIGEKLANKITE